MNLFSSSKLQAFSTPVLTGLGMPRARETNQRQSCSRVPQSSWSLSSTCAEELWVEIVLPVEQHRYGFFPYFLILFMPRFVGYTVGWFSLFKKWSTLISCIAIFLAVYDALYVSIMNRFSCYLYLIYYLIWEQDGFVFLAFAEIL